jgi:hypothetical protein
VAAGQQHHLVVTCLQVAAKEQETSVDIQAEDLASGQAEMLTYTEQVVQDIRITEVAKVVEVSLAAAASEFMQNRLTQELSNLMLLEVPAALEQLPVVIRAQTALAEWLLFGILDNGKK